MGDGWTFETAATFWSRSRSHPERAWTSLLSAERFLFDHPPRTAGEAARVLEVLIGRAGARRDDGREAEALARVHRYLQQLERFEGRAIAAAAATTCGPARRTDSAGDAVREKMEPGSG